MKKVSLICTVLNEESTIVDLLQAVKEQSVVPNEFIIVDGGSSDGTVSIIDEFSKSNKQLHITLIEKKSSIAAARNLAVQKAKYPLIAITDAGCVPQKNWLHELLRVYEKNNAPVVAGFYKGMPKTDFEEAVVPYVLVMPDTLNEETFLPATRSMLIEKKLWLQLGGLNEAVQVSEDYMFAKKIAAQNIPIAVAKNALVEWMPRKNLRQFISMMFAFAKNDLQGNVLRGKVILIFVRYICAVLILVSLAYFSPKNMLLTAVLGLILYAFWAITKNKRYVQNGWYWLPVLQLASDAALMLGTISGIKKI